MAKKRRRSSSSMFASDAAAQSLVRYGPEISGLKALRQQLENNFRGAVSQSDATAQATQQAVAQAIPQLAGMYDQSGLQQAAVNQTLTAHDLAGLTGPGADYLKGAGALEAAAMAGRLGAAKTHAVTDLTNRGVQASEGRTFAINNARSQFTDDLAKLIQRGQDLARERGAFEAATIGDLQGKQDDRQFTATEKALDRSNALLTAGVDPTGQLIPGGKADKPARSGPPRLPGGVKLASPTEHGAARDKIAEAMAQARQLLAGGRSRPEIAQVMVNGRPAMTVTKDENKNPLKEPRKVPAIRATGELWTSVALDLLHDGHVSHRNAELLHKRGLSLKGLGYPAPPRGAARRQQTAANQAGQVAGSILQALGIGG